LLQIKLQGCCKKTEEIIVMRKKTVTSMIGIAALGLFGVMATAQASIVSGTSDIDFSNDTYTLNLADGAASYSFANGGSSGFGDFNAAIKSNNSDSLVATNPPILGGGPATYFTGDRSPYIGPDLLAIFKPIDSFEVGDYSGNDTFFGLAFNLDDGTHYGYAEVAGTQFLGYGYQTVAGEGIRAGAMAPVAVPEPGSLGMLSAGLVLIGVGAAAARRRQKN
jgi:hypothetical protein